jgi:hypothetical protein
VVNVDLFSRFSLLQLEDVSRVAYTKALECRAELLSKGYVAILKRIELTEIAGVYLDWQRWLALVIASAAPI